jgi:hypothetical protein
MENLTMSQKGNILTIEIDISKRGNKSTSGKSIIVASTGGNIAVPGNEHVKLGLNCYVAAK